MRNSEKRTAEDSDMSDGNQDVSALLADLKKQLAEVTSGSFDRDETPKRFQKKKERLAKENKSKFNIEPQHNFNLEEDTQGQRKVLSQQQQQQSYNQQQQRNQFNLGQHRGGVRGVASAEVRAGDREGQEDKSRDCL